MIENIEFKGNWALPNNKKTVYGKLTYSPIEGGLLEVYDTLGKKFETEYQEIIIGQTDNGYVTLIDSFNLSFQVSSGVSSEAYKPKIILKGHQFFDINGIQFREVIVSLFNLNNWFGKTGIDFKSKDKTTDYEIHYSQPDEINFELKKGCCGKIYYDSFPNFNEKGSVSIKEQCFLKLSYDEKTPIHKILRDINIIQGFFTLVIFEQTYPINIFLKDKDVMQQLNDIVKPIHCYYSTKAYNSLRRTKYKHQHLVQYKNIQGYFPKLLFNWYQKYNELKPPFFLLLNSFIDDKTFNEEDFVDMIRAIETFHRKNHNNHVLDKNEFMELINRILKNENINNKETKWLKEKLNFANEPTLKQRLLELLEIYNNAYLKHEIGDPEFFSRKVKNSRNYYTHFSPNLERKAQVGVDLMRLTDTLKGLLISCILNTIGIENNIFEERLIEILGKGR